MEEATLPRHVVRLQAAVRGFLARREYRSRLVRCRQRTNVAREILRTEQSYVSSLHTMTDMYIHPILEMIESGEGGDLEGLSILQQTASKAQYIISLNETFCGDLNARIEGWDSRTCIGDVFLRTGPFLKMYTAYTDNFQATAALLGKVNAEKRGPLYKLLEEIGSKHGPELLALNAFLIMPIQRVPRYTLLLEDLLKHTWKDHPDFENLCEALKMYKGLADFINRSIDRCESITRVAQIQNRLGGEVQLVQPHRRWVKDGRLLSPGRLGKVKLFIYLFTDLLVVASKVLTSYRWRHSFPLYAVWLVDLPETRSFPHVFQVRAPNQPTYTVLAASSEEKEEWMSAIRQARAYALKHNSSYRQKRELLEEKMEGLERLTHSLQESATADSIYSSVGSNLEADERFTLMMIADGMESQDRAAEEGGTENGTSTLETVSLSFAERRELFERGLVEEDEAGEAAEENRKAGKRDSLMIQRGLAERKMALFRAIQAVDTRLGTQGGEEGEGEGGEPMGEEMGTGSSKRRTSVIDEELKCVNPGERRSRYHSARGIYEKRVKSGERRERIISTGGLEERVNISGREEIDPCHNTPNNDDKPPLLEIPSEGSPHVPALPSGRGVGSVGATSERQPLLAGERGANLNADASKPSGCCKCCLY